MVTLTVVAAGCGSDDDDATAATTTTPPTSAPTTTIPATSSVPTTEATDTGEGDTGSTPSGGIGGLCIGAQAPSGVQYAVTGIPADDPDGGLVARALPDASAEAYGTLAEGTIVDTFAEADSCRVADDGGVWWDIGTPQLATGGWVNSGFLEPIGDEQDGFDLESAQVACVYEGNAAACDLLTTFGYPEADNYGLGNSLSQTPDGFLAEDCQAGNALTCAEIELRAG